MTKQQELEDKTIKAIIKIIDWLKIPKKYLNFDLGAEVSYIPNGGNGYSPRTRVIEYSDDTPKTIFHESSHYLHHVINPHLDEIPWVKEPSRLYIHILSETFAHATDLHFCEKGNMIHIDDFLQSTTLKHEEYTKWDSDLGRLLEEGKENRVRALVESNPEFSKKWLFWAYVNLALKKGNELCDDLKLYAIKGSPFSKSKKRIMESYAKNVLEKSEKFYPSRYGINIHQIVACAIGYDLAFEINKYHDSNPKAAKKLLRDIITAKDDNIVRTVYKSFRQIYRFFEKKMINAS